MKRALNEQEIRDMLRYYAHCQSLRDFIDVKVVATKFCYQKIKALTNQLVNELEKQVDVLMDVKIEDNTNQVLDQFVNASIQADYLFEVALKMELLEDSKKTECAAKLSNVLKEYGIK
jgi:hypothetical protein